MIWFTPCSGEPPTVRTEPGRHTLSNAETAPLPNCPDKFLPQQYTLSSFSAQAKSIPIVICETPLSGLPAAHQRVGGAGLIIPRPKFPSPSWPTFPSPQHLTPPAVNQLHSCVEPPNAIPLTPEAMAVTGVGFSSVVPSPSWP